MKSYSIHFLVLSILALFLYGCGRPLEVNGGPDAITKLAPAGSGLGVPTQQTDSGLGFQPSVGSGTGSVTDRLIGLQAAPQAPVVIAAAPTIVLKANNTLGAITIAHTNTGATLSWSTTGATACTLNTVGRAVNHAGFPTGALTATTVYTLACTGAGGAASAKVTVNVQAAPAAPAPAPAPTCNGRMVMGRCMSVPSF